VARYINVVTAFDGNVPAFVLAVVHGEHMYIPISFAFLADFCY
jgi:hypothetical protein